MEAMDGKFKPINRSILPHSHDYKLPIGNQKKTASQQGRTGIHENFLKTRQYRLDPSC
jgi:hypothetical protein